MFDITKRKLAEGRMLFYEHGAITQVIKLADSRRVGEWTFEFEPFNKELTPAMWADYFAKYVRLAERVGMASDAFVADVTAVLDAAGEKAPKTRAFLRKPKPGALSDEDVAYVAGVITKAPVVAAADVPIPVGFSKYGVVMSPTGKVMHMSSPPGYRASTKSYHKGFDAGMPAGTPLRALDNGIVTFYSDPGGYGLYAMLVADDRAYLYGHLSEALVKSGSRVSVGTTIAKSGNSGKSFGPHLHFEVRVPPLTKRRATQADVDNLLGWIREAKNAGILT